MFDFSNYSTKSKYYDDSNKLAIEKMNDEIGAVATEEFVVEAKDVFIFSL